MASVTSGGLKKSDCVPRNNFIVNVCFTVKRLIAKYRHGSMPNQPQISLPFVCCCSVGS